MVDDLFHSMEWEESPGHGASGVIFPPHCCKSVGLSPYIDGVIKLQNNYSLSRQHCIAICFNVVTSESPFYFWKVVMDLLDDLCVCVYVCVCVQECVYFCCVE